MPRITTRSGRELRRFAPYPTRSRSLAPVQGWRAMFDLVPDESLEPITLRLYLRGPNGQPLTETWLYEYEPPPLNERPLI